ncbi:hypothetical protein Tco_1511725, partial [Tanacetum coccineum]
MSSPHKPSPKPSPKPSRVAKMSVRLICTDIAKIPRKRSKLDKHEHENGRAHKEPKVFYKKVKKSTIGQHLVNNVKVKWSNHKKSKPKNPKRFLLIFTIYQVHQIGHTAVSNCSPSLITFKLAL